MLQSIRDHTQGWIAGVIISLLILSFALWGIHSYLVEGSSKDYIAKVNGVEITKDQFAIAYERLRRQLQMQYNSTYKIPKEIEANIKERAIQALIDIQVLKQASLAEGYRVSSRQIDTFLASMPEFQVNGQFSESRFQRILQTTLYNPVDFLELIKTSLLIDQPRLGLIFTSIALPNEINSTIALINQERNIQYVVLPLNTIPKESIQISEDKIKDYYDQHKDEFKTSEKISIEFVDLSLKNLISTIQPTDEQLKNFYNENSSSFTQPMQWKLESIVIPFSANEKEIQEAKAKANSMWEQAVSGKSFSMLKQQFSINQKTEQQQLNGWITIDKVPAHLQNAILSLNKPGQISNVIQSSDGFVIFKVDAIKQAVVQPFAEVKEKVKTTYQYQKAEEKFAELREKLTDIAYEHPDSLELIIQKLGLPVKSSVLFTKDKGGEDITSNTKVREIAFSDEVLIQKNNSDVIPVTAEDAVVIRVKTHIPETLLSLKSVENQIKNKLIDTEQETKLFGLANEIKLKLQNGADLNQIAQQYHGSWKNIGFIGRHTDKVNSAILETAFALPQPNSNKSTYAVVKTVEGYSVVALLGVRDGNAVNKEQYQIFAQQIQNSQGLLEYDLYKRSLMSRAKIDTGN